MGNCLSCLKSTTHESTDDDFENQRLIASGEADNNYGTNKELDDPNSNGQQGNMSLPINEDEREAVSLLLQYLEDKDRYDFYTGGPLEALTTLSYSENINLRRSAALAFAEITEKFVRAVPKEVIEPILALLTDEKTLWMSKLK